MPADVEPDRRVERRHLVQQDVRQLRLEAVRVVRGGKVATLPSPAGDRAGDSPDHLLHRALPHGRSELTAEVLLGHDVGGVLRPALGELDLALLEGDLVAAADARVTQLPLHRVERMHPGIGEVTADREAFSRLCRGRQLALRGVLHNLPAPLVFRCFRCFGSAPGRATGQQRDPCARAGRKEGGRGPQDVRPGITNLSYYFIAVDRRIRLEGGGQGRCSRRGEQPSARPRAPMTSTNIQR